MTLPGCSGPSDASELPLRADKPGCPSVLHACRPCSVAAEAEAGAAEEERRRREEKKREERRPQQPRLRSGAQLREAEQSPFRELGGCSPAPAHPLGLSPACTFIRSREAH